MRDNRTVSNCLKVLIGHIEKKKIFSRGATRRDENNVCLEKQQKWSVKYTTLKKVREHK